MGSTRYTSLDLCAVRVSKLTEAGAPATGANNGYVSDAAITLGVSVTIESGDELSQKNGMGLLCAVLNEPDRIKGIGLEAEFCQLDAYIFQLLTGAELFVDGSDAIGFQYPAVGSTPDPICFEGWSKAWDMDKQAADQFTNGDATYIHWVFPYTRWVPGDITLEHQLLIAPATAKGSENDQITANGPFDDWPAEVAGLGGVTRIGGWFFDTTPPEADGDYVAVNSAAS